MKSASAVRRLTLPVAAASFLFLASSGLVAQDAVIQGTVRTDQGASVSGASVRVLDTDLGTFVDSEGSFRLVVPPGTHRVQASALGRRASTREVTVQAGESRTIDFVLPVSAVQLRELVASVEAGTVTRRQMGTDIASINAAEEVEKAAASDLSGLLNARAGNVTVRQTSGNVGSGSRIRIRGLNSLTQDNNPLLIVDGVRADQNTDVGINRGQTFSRFNDLAPSDIESIEVVKGPAATALYGSEASPGVLIVTTKRGEQGGGAPRITVGTEHGAQWDRAEYPDNLADVTPFVTGADDPRLSQWPVRTNELTGQVYVSDNPFMDTDSRPFRTARNSNGSVSAAGGVEALSYYSALRYQNDEGVLPSNDVERLNFRANFSTNPSEVVSIQTSAGYVNSTINLPKSGNNTSGFFANAIDGVPMASLGTGGDCLATVLAGEDPSFCDRNGNTRAAFDKIEAVISKQDLERFTASAIAVVTPSDWLTFRGTVGTDVASTEFQDAIPFDPDIPFSFAAGGENFLTADTRRTLTGDFAATAEFPISEDLTGTTTAGAQYFQNLRETVACEGRVFPNDQATACDAAVNLRGFSDRVENVEVGAFLQQRFSFRDYLFVTGALRVDDNSAFGDRQEEIYSPSANASLVVSDLPGWDVELVSSLRVRAAWGKANQSPDQFAADRTFVISRLGRDGGVVAGLSPQDPGNPDLGAERSEEFELGFNAGVLEDRIGIDFTYFNRNTSDAIIGRPVPPSAGFPNDRFENIAELSNKGFELALDGQVVDRDDVGWSLRFQWSATDPVVTDLGGEGPIFLGFSQVVAEGETPGAYVSRVITDAERDENGEIVPGSIQYAEGTLGDGSGRRVVGQPFPTNTQSLSSTLNLFGNLRIFALFDRKGGNELYAAAEDGRNPGSLAGTNSRFGERWAFRHTQETPEDQAMMEQDRLVGNHDAVWIHDGAFIKFREMSVSYRLPTSVSRTFGSGNARIYAGARNLLTITADEFPEPWDPESQQEGARDNLRFVVDNTLPQPPMVFGGLQVSF
jgi:TonB-linked SusC/RagA family outer membrane protein